MKSGIYRIKVGNKYYFGRSIDLTRRKWQHRTQLEKGVHHNVILQNSYNKYKDFEFIIIGYGEYEDLQVFEQLFLDWTNNCNLKDASRGFEPGNKVNLGRRVSEKTKKLKSKMFSGKGNPSYSHTKYKFIHPDFGERLCTQFELRKEFKLSQGNLSMMVNGKRKSVKGWRIKEKLLCLETH